MAVEGSTATLNPMEVKGTRGHGGTMIPKERAHSIHTMYVDLLCMTVVVGIVESLMK